MYDKPTGRDLLKTTATLAATSALALNCGALALAKQPADTVAGTLQQVDAVVVHAACPPPVHPGCALSRRRFLNCVAGDFGATQAREIVALRQPIQGLTCHKFLGDPMNRAGIFGGSNF